VDRQQIEHQHRRERLLLGLAGAEIDQARQDRAGRFGDARREAHDARDDRSRYADTLSVLF